MRYLSILLLLLSGCGSATIMFDETITTEELKKRNYYIKSGPVTTKHERFAGSMNVARTLQPKEKGTVIIPFPNSE